MEQVVIACCWTERMTGITLFISKLIHAQIDKIFIWKNIKKCIAHKIRIIQLSSFEGNGLFFLSPKLLGFIEYSIIILKALWICIYKITALTVQK